MTKNQILGYILLHRHGQRAPIRNIYNNINEVNIWNSFLPNNLILNNLDEKYPTKRDLNIKEQYDLKIKPFSCLTLIGINYMINIGKQVKEKFPLINKGKIINVYSTNYHRTQVSAKSFLTGLEAKEGTEINVKPPQECSLSFFEGRPEIAKKLTIKVQSYPEFQRDEEQSFEKLGKTLTEIFPGLVMSDSSTKSSSALNHLPINWMAALDYFTCREAHSLPIDERIQHLKNPVISYVASRYRAYYTDLEHRTHSVIPILKDIYSNLRNFESQLTQSTTPISSPEFQPFGTVIYSGHDVNLLGLLHGMNATLVDINQNSNEGHWPDFGSVLVFELVTSSQLNNHEKHDVMVNLYYNNKPLMIRKDGIEVNSIDLDTFQRLFLSNSSSSNTE